MDCPGSFVTIPELSRLELDQSSDVEDFVGALGQSFDVALVSQHVRDHEEEGPLEAGRFIAPNEAVALPLLEMHDGAPVNVLLGRVYNR